MKKITNLMILMILGSSVLFAQITIKEQIENNDPLECCEYSITMWDDIGDGWNGGYVQIFGDGIEIFNGTLSTGAGPETFEFLVQHGSFLTAVWNAGGWSYECSYAIFDADDNLIFEDGMGGVDPTGGDIGVAFCYTPDFDAGITEIMSPNNGINLGDEVVTVNIHNFGLLELIDIPVGFTVDNGNIIMEIAPGPISSGGSFEYTFAELADLSEGGQHNIEACTFLDAEENPDNDCFEKSIHNSIQINDQTFNLSEGYQFISSYINPYDPDMIVVMVDILNDNLGFVRNSQGQTLRKIGPNWVNGIGNWIIEEGYLVKMFGDDSFTIEGELVDPSTPIPLYAGYQFVSYLSTTSIDALEAFVSIIGDNLDFIRNSQGQTLRKIGPNWVNGIGDCNPDEGYLVKMFSEDILIYPFTCGDPFTDSRDGQTYNSVQIGDQCWMAENLNIGTQIDGVITMSDNSIIEKYCYDDDSMNCEIFGGLYQWNEMMQYKTTQSEQGICPNGWHLPSDAEWFVMENYLDPSINNPDITGWRGIDCGEQLLAGGSSGFEALFAGLKNWDTGEFLEIGERGFFWSSTINPYNPIHSWFRRLHRNNPQSYRNGASKLFGLSVRCLRDETSISSKKTVSILNDENFKKPKHSKKHIVKTDYFTFNGGNPADPVYSLYLEGLEIGDEVAAFDGEIMLGSMRISSEKEFNNELPVFSTLINGKGYKEGNPIILKIWDNSTQSLIPFEYNMMDPYNEAYMNNIYPEEDGLYSIIKFTKGVNNIENIEENISIFPNPSEGIFNISIEGVSENIQVKVFDVHGNDYRFFEIDGTKNLSTQQLDLKELAAGVYFISFSNKNFNQVKKIVIQ